MAVITPETPRKRIEFTQAELDYLSWSLGIATAAAMKDQPQSTLPRKLMELHNKIAEAPEL